MTGRKGNAHVRDIAVCAMMAAFLIAVQYVLGYVPGVELVTVLLLTFSYCFGAAMGMTAATAFSLLRCLLWGFEPKVIVLYLVYFNLFAFAFGMLGRRAGKPVAAWIVPVIIAAMAGFCAYFAVAGVKVSVLYQENLRVMLWVLFSVFSALFVFYIALLFVRTKRGGTGREIATVTATACLFTVCFTLFDDVLTPLWYAFTPEAAIAYFYTGFLAMIPQTICTAFSVFLLFYPLTRLFFRIRGEKPPRSGDEAGENFAMPTK